MAAAIVLPHAFVEAVVEIEIFELAEFGTRRRKQPLDAFDVVVHRAADIEEHQKLHRVASFWPRSHVEIAMLGGGVDGAGQVELLGGALAHPAAQPLQRDLDVAGAELDAVVEIPELAPVPDLHRALWLLSSSRCTPSIVAIGAEGEVPAVPIHFEPPWCQPSAPPAAAAGLHQPLEISGA